MNQVSLLLSTLVVIYCILIFCSSLSDILFLLYFVLISWTIIDLAVVLSNREININQSRLKALGVTLWLSLVQIVVFGGTFFLLKANNDIATALVALLLFSVDEKVGLSLSLFFRRINSCEANKYRLTGSALNCLLFIKWTSLFLVFGSALGKNLFTKSDDTLLTVTVTTTALLYLAVLLIILVMYGLFNLDYFKKFKLVENIKENDDGKGNGETRCK